MGRGENQPTAQLPDKVPVTLLCGFLGAGKTTLLKHILETKHSDEDFNCAVIVNDMAELNIDKSLIDNTSLIQSDEAMIGMQNGCICCTLQTDLVDQIVGLTQKKKFNYILIEASGVSEPHEIAPLFEIDDHEQCEATTDMVHDHDKPQLGEVARLDTCVTLIDSDTFYNNLGSMKTYENSDIFGTITELMMDQVEFANVILLNKVDLVKEQQLKDILEKLQALNPGAKVIKTRQSKIDVMEILNTSLYSDKDNFVVTSTKNETKYAKEAEEAKKAGKWVPDACTARFDINSFVYRARKPFHPKRLNKNWLMPFFADPLDAIEKEEENKDVTEEEEEEKEPLKGVKLDEEKQSDMEKSQAEALERQKLRNETLGEILRSKGFSWMATSNDLIGSWQQAGNVLRIKAESYWMCLKPEIWEDTDAAPVIRKDMQKENGEDWEYKDRRQEIVFIGHKMKKDAITKLLDECLLTDEEMALGPEKWLETMKEFDTIELELVEEDEDEEDEEDQDEEDEEGQNEDSEDEQSEKQDDEEDNDNEESIKKALEKALEKAQKKRSITKDPGSSNPVKRKKAQPEQCAQQ